MVDVASARDRAELFVGSQHRRWTHVQAVARLRQHRDELLGQLEAADLQSPSDTDLADVRRDLEGAIRDGSPAQVKALARALVH